MTVQKRQGMVDVGRKRVTERTALAEATLLMGKKAFTALARGECPKGDVLETARVAGVMAAKSTPSIIPFCHPLELSKVEMTFQLDRGRSAVIVRCRVNYRGRTGVEMEALTAVSAAALTVYDMMKWCDKSMSISEVKLLEKSGGKSGDFKRR